MTGTPEPRPGGEVVVYEAPDGEVALDVRLEQETVWLTMRQMADLFERDRSVVNRHVLNVFQEGELERGATCADSAQVRPEGGRRVTRKIEHFNLDVIISVGYRVKSLRGTQFRQWATRRLREHLVSGYTLNRRRLAERGLREARETLDLLARTLRNQALVEDTGRAVLELVTRYADTWRLLLEYDEDRLEAPACTRPPSAALDHGQAVAAIGDFRAALIARGEASPLFGNPRGEALEGILGNVEQRPRSESLSTEPARRRPRTCSTPGEGPSLHRRQQAHRLASVLALPSPGGAASRPEPPGAHRAHPPHRRKRSRQQGPVGPSDRRPAGGPGGMNSFTVGALDRELAYERRRVPCDLRIMPHRIQPPRQLLGELIAVEERVSANATAGRLPVLLAPALQQRVRLESSGVAGGRAGSWVQTVSAESRCAAMRWRSFGSRGRSAEVSDRMSHVVSWACDPAL